ncbi:MULTISPECIES: protein YrbN [Erwiniaceae]|uniref:Protein YrbN n=1 Tax=Erwinia psidii TaxID=69224 RepID=A0A3N6UNB6_9GAMM|nr:protein YrbN [Erwinia psidii]MCX8962026.1 protein YrbN [Erwinia psidii]MCX8965644.1 protein YrbN [Erwinia psidii]RQM37429.1 protein YrbN [Erwinia psidii]
MKMTENFHDELCRLAAEI